MGFKKPSFTVIDATDLQFTDDELRLAALRSANNYLRTIQWLYWGRRLSWLGYSRLPNPLRVALKERALAAAQRWSVYVLVSSAGNLRPRTYVGFEAAQVAQRLSGDSTIVELTPAGTGTPIAVVRVFMEQFPGNERLVDDLLRRWCRQVRYRFSFNAPRSRAKVIAEARQLHHLTGQLATV